ncbi:uncharacterized protein [Palaemon carinicauda]|uniref:uncharacterized protein n=1 Tax=Palaemon carinicauda TaxID=392227 RepID=UPI0035B6A5F1
MLDFEKAAMNSVKRHFPHSQISGCLFHFGQCMWRIIQAQGLASWYTESPKNAMLIKSLQVLAFVPLQDVSDTFEQFVSSLEKETDNIMGDFLTYFEATWIGNARRGRRRLPVFPQELWNVHERVLQNLPRTNNSIEGCHRAFDLQVAITYPTQCRFADRLRKEQASNKLIIDQANAGIALPPMKKKYENINQQQKDLVEKYDITPVLRFLRSIAHNL